MSQFNQLVVAYGREDDIQLAGIEKKFNRPMIIHSSRVNDSALSPLQITMMFQCTIQEREKDEAYAQVKRGGYIASREEVKVPFALCEFYSFQKEFTEEEPLVITVDTTRKATEIAELRSMKYVASLKQVEGIKFGTNEIVEKMKRKIYMELYARKVSDYTLKILEKQIDQNVKDALYHFIHTKKTKVRIVLTSPCTGYQYKFSIRRWEYTELLKESMEEVVAIVKKYIVPYPYWIRKKCKLILSGEIYISEEAIHIFEEKLETIEELYGYKILHYKPKEVAVLGGTLVCKKMSNNHDDYELGEVYYASEKMGAIRNLNQTERKIYYDLLETILKGKEKIQVNDMKMFSYKLMDCLARDFPQIELLCNSSSKLLEEVEHVADKILKECVKEEFSDKEAFENIYNYICKNYHYQNKRDREGGFSDYSYTIATLLENGVCKGYSLSLVYLAGKIQIPVSYIVGNAGSEAFSTESLHAWNQLETTTGDVFHIDSTWDLGNNLTKNYLYHDDVGIQSRKHFWNKLEYPTCS